MPYRPGDWPRSDREPRALALLAGGAAAPAAEQVDQMRHQRFVRRRHRKTSEVARGNPFHGLAFPARDEALPPATDVEWHQKMKCFVSETREGEGGETRSLHDDAEFLGEFADQRLLRALAGVDLAAGKFPEAGQRLALGALRDQHPSVGVDEGAGDHQQHRLPVHAGQLR